MPHLEFSSSQKSSVGRKSVDSVVPCLSNLLIVPMSFLFNQKQPGDYYDNWSPDLATNRGNKRFLSGSNILHPNVDGDPGLIIFSNHIQTLLPSFTLEPKVESVHTSDSFSQFSTCLSASDLQVVSPDGCVENSSLWYSAVPLGGPRSSFPLYQQSQVHSYSDLPLFHPSELAPGCPHLCPPIICLAYSNYQYHGNQAVLHVSNKIDVRAKHIPSIFDGQPCTEITHPSSLIWSQTNDVMRLGNNIHSSCLTDNAFNNNVVLHRLNREGISLVRPHHFTEQNHQTAGLTQPMMALARVNGANYLSIGTKHKALEEGREEVWWKKRRNLHRCRLCNMSFSTGNALGGHMSFHAKQKKLKAKSIGQLSKQPLESDVTFACTFASVLQDSINLSMEAFGW